MPRCASIDNTDNAQLRPSTGHIHVVGHQVLRTAGEYSRMPRGIWTAQARRQLHSHTEPHSEVFVYYKVTFSPFFPLYKVCNAGRCLAESVFQERVQKGSTWLRYTPLVSRQDCLSLTSISDKHTNRKGLLPACVLSQCDFCISKA